MATVSIDMAAINMSIIGSHSDKTGDSAGLENRYDGSQKGGTSQSSSGDNNNHKDNPHPVDHHNGQTGDNNFEAKHVEGTVKDRKCRDVTFLIIFAAFLGGMVCNTCVKRPYKTKHILAFHTGGCSLPNNCCINPCCTIWSNLDSKLTRLRLIRLLWLRS